MTNVTVVLVSDEDVEELEVPACPDCDGHPACLEILEDGKPVSYVIDPRAAVYRRVPELSAEIPALPDAETVTV